MRTTKDGEPCPYCDSDDLQSSDYQIECIPCGSRGGRHEPTGDWSWAARRTVDAYYDAMCDAERDLDGVS